ncbi:MAG: permease [Candidatus Gastranaerophilales bacterium]
MFLKFADWLIYGVFGLSSETNYVAALHFFVYDVIKILFLLFVIISVISFLRGQIDNDKFRKFIEKQPRPVAHFLAAILGAITPFCSCSSIPIFIGFLEAGLPFGVAMTFLITSPMINEIAILVLASVVGWKITALYLVTGVAVGMIGGYLMEKFGFKKYLQDYLIKPKACSCSSGQGKKEKSTLKTKVVEAIDYAKDLMEKIWLFVMLGVGVGAFLHGYVPAEFFVTHLGDNNFWAVPVAVLAGIPLYADATTIIPIAQVLINKGAAIGTVLVFMMATVGLSLPEMIIISRVMKKELIIRFVVFMFVTFILVGYLYNWLI